MRRIAIPGWLLIAAIAIYLGVTTQDDQLRTLEFLVAASAIAVAGFEVVALVKAKRTGPSSPSPNP